MPRKAVKEFIHVFRWIVPRVMPTYLLHDTFMRLDRETLDPWWQQYITTEAATIMTMTVIDVSMGPPNKTKLQLFGFSFQLAGQF